MANSPAPALSLFEDEEPGTDAGSGLFSGKSGRTGTKPHPYPKEFSDNVVRVALGRDKDTTIAQIAKHFGIHEDTIAKWLRQADIDAGNKPGTTTDESAELRELRPHTRLLERRTKSSAGR
jgi:transposase